MMPAIDGLDRPAPRALGPSRIGAGLFDADGFLLSMDDWSEDMARWIAKLDGLGDLDPGQLALLRQLRASYRRRGALPAWPHVCRLGGFAPDCMTRLFPSAREVWRVAGLPNPGEEAKAYL